MRKLSALVVFVLLIAHGAAFAETPSIRRFQLPDHGTLVVAVPSSWQADVSQPPNRLPPTLKFSSKAGPAFEVLITPLWPMLGKTPPADSATIRKEVESTAEETKPHAIEKQLEVKALTGSDSTGYYFAATDRAPNPGEYKHLVQGILPIGNLAVAFTILTNGSDVTERAALLMLQSATLKR